MSDLIARGLAKKTQESLLAQQENLLTHEDILQTIVHRGVATSGANGYIEDTTKTWQVDQFVGKTIRVYVDGTYYYPTITSNTETRIDFDAFDPPTNARATIGSGDEGAGEGQVVLTAISTLSGAVGNECSVVIVNGNTDTGEKHASYDAETKLLTFTVDTNGLGEQMIIGAGDIGPILIADGLDNIFNVDSMVAGNLPKDFEAIPFADGSDGTPISAGDEYEIAYSVVIDNLNDQVIQLNELTTYLNDISNTPSFIGQEALVSGVWYKAIGTSSVADWKQMTVSS
jgi:hypothetical protein